MNDQPAYKCYKWNNQLKGENKEIIIVVSIS